MALSDIKIYRDFNIVNDFVQVPHNQEVDKNRITPHEAINIVPDAEVQELTLGSGKCTGSKFGAQRFVRLPPLRPGETYLSRYGYDPTKLLSWQRDPTSLIPTTPSN